MGKKVNSYVQRVMELQRHHQLVTDRAIAVAKMEQRLQEMDREITELQNEQQVIRSTLNHLFGLDGEG